MKKFIVSDLHGDGNAYNSIMNYLENRYTEEDLILYMNGDLIDRGPDSADMLVDMKYRIDNNHSFPIIYLGGNHELMMYQASLNRRNGVWPQYSNWFGHNGGEMTAYGLENLVTEQEENEIIDFVSDLKIYNKFTECIDDKQIVLVHAKCPYVVNNVCDMRISDNDNLVEDAVWTRKIDFYTFTKFNLGNPSYFTIIGHTPVEDKRGYEYDPIDNTLNIDGGCAPYVKGFLKYDHIPLVELDTDNNRLIILTFNNNNEIITGNYFSEGKSIPLTETELSYYKKFLGKDVKIRKLVLD